MILVFTDITISEESSIEWTGGVWSTSLDPIPTDGKTEQVSLVQNQNYFMTSTASICRWKRVAQLPVQRRVRHGACAKEYQTSRHGTTACAKRIPKLL